MRILRMLAIIYNENHVKSSLFISNGYPIKIELSTHS